MGKTFAAIAVLIGTIIGAGILGLPYVASQAGFSITVLHLVVIGVAILLVMLYLGEIVLRTKKAHQLTGYAELYLGKIGKRLMLGSLIIGIGSAVAAYLIGEGQSISYLVFGNTSNFVLCALGFWVLIGLLNYFGRAALEKGELLGVTLVIITVISIVIFGFSRMSPSNLQFTDYSKFFLPFGVVLFAYLGFSAVPQMKLLLSKQRNERLMRRSIIWAHLIVFAIYLAFTAAVVGLLGRLVPEIATFGLGRGFVFLGILTMFGAYLALTIALSETMHLDYKFSRFRAWAFANLIPLLFFFAARLIGGGFILVLGIGGVVAGALAAVCILLMIKPAKMHGDRRPEYSLPYSRIISIVLVIIFVVGGFLELVHLFS